MHDRNDSPRGVITHIQRFSLHDGPGIRSTVFFKGCSNACEWCHNPETIRLNIEIQWLPSRCIACGECLRVCPNDAHELTPEGKRFHRERCDVRGACVEACYSGALMRVGRDVSAEEVVKEIETDRAYYERSGGGVTLSGGDPVIQADFAHAVLNQCREAGIHTALETAGNYPWERLERLLPRVDLVMIDLKIANPEIHRRYIGNDGSRIRENLSRLMEQEVDLIVRTPVIGGVNDNVEEIISLASFVQKAPRLLYYELLPYHPLGGDKYESLGRPAPSNFTIPTPERIVELAETARQFIPRVLPL